MAVRYFIMAICLTFFINTAFRGNIFANADDGLCIYGATYYRRDNVNADRQNKTGCEVCICLKSGKGYNCLERPQWHCLLLKENSVPDDHPVVHSKLLSLRLRRLLRPTRKNEKNEEMVCTPGLQKYDNCTAENICSGCRICECLLTGEWICEAISDCSGRTESKQSHHEVEEPPASTLAPNYRPHKNDEVLKLRMRDIEDEINRLTVGALQMKALNKDARHRRSYGYPWMK